MSGSERNRDRINAQLPSRIYSEPVPRRPRISLLSPVRIIEEAVGDIRDNVRRALETRYSSDNDSDSELHPNIVIERVFPFVELDQSLLADNRSEHEGSSLISYDSSIFDNAGTNLVNMPRQQPSTSRANGDVANDRPIANAEVDAEIGRLRGTIGEPPAQRQNRQEELLDKILEAMAGMQDRISRIEIANYDRENFPFTRPDNGTLNVTYGRTINDVRELRDRPVGYLRLKDARSLIPEIDGHSRQKMQEFISASTYAMEKINYAEKPALLEEILNTKLKGKLLLDFQTRSISDFEQLRQEIEANYLGKRGTSHLQLEFNALKQRPGESAHTYGRRVDTLAMELYESLIEKRSNTSEQKRAILETIQDQALLNFELGLREDIKLVVRSQKYTSLQEAINAASAEEKVKGPVLRAHNHEQRYKNGQNQITKNSGIQCSKCGKIGHYGRDCRSSRYANRFSLPRADKPANINSVDKYCTYCKKAGHKRNECWSLNGRPDRDTKPRAKRDNEYKTKHVNSAVRARRNKQQSESEESSYASSEEEREKRKTRRTRAANAHQITQVTGKYANTGLRLVTLPIKEMKKGRINLLLDTGATLTLIKVGNLKGETLIREKPMALTGVTGHQAKTIGKIRATVRIGDEEIRHTMHVVKDDFPIDYEGILGMDFLQKHKIRSDQKNYLKIDGVTLKLHPYTKITLTPRSETIVRAVTDKNRVGIVKSEETRPGIFIGNCLVAPDEYTCAISMLNTTEKTVEIITPLVTVKELRASNRDNVLTLRKTGNMSGTLTLPRHERVRTQIRTAHLNKEEKRTIEQICEDFNDIFHLEGDVLTHTTAVAHEINTRIDSAPVNVRPYRLPEKHKEEVNRQIDKMLEDEIIQPSSSQWNAPLLVVPKKGDTPGNPKLRIVIDFRKLNDLTIGDSFPLPNITDILDQLGNAKYFSTLDLASGYHQIPMNKEHQNKTAFSTSHGHYEFNRMPFGLRNAPATFQRLMNTILAGIQGLRCLVYLDDIVIYGPNLEEHNKRLVEVMQRLRKYNLKLQPDKCEFLRKEVIYLGHIITEEGIRPDPSKLSAVKDFPVPKKIKDVQSFIGLAGYYRKFIADFSKIAKPLTSLTKKGVKFEWKMEQQNAFELLKVKLTTAPILSYPDFTREFLVTTDASDLAIGAVLSQGPVGQDRPIAYASRILNKAEQNYNTTEKELLAIVWAVKYFRPYLYGTTFTIVTDHRPLVWLFNVNDPGSRLMRWRLKLEEYDYKIVHKAGKGNTNADALSRNPIRQDERVHSVQQRKKEDEEEKEDTVREYTEEDKRQILYEYHDAPTGGHQGVTRTLNRIRLLHNWRGITKDVEEYVSKCEYCQKNKLSRKTRMPLEITDTPTKPFEKCALDIVGPLTVTTAGNKYILTFQDNLTKFSKAIPIENQEAATVAKMFVTRIMVEYGIPEKLLTDQGTNFTSEMFKNVCKLLRIEKIQTTAYHPESNGALERSHRTLAEYLRHYINEQQSDWDEWIPYAMFAYNTTPHTATGFTPFELMYGHQATLPTALTKPPKPTYSYEDYAQELRERIRATNQIAREHAQEEKIKAKQHYDKSANKKTFVIGDKVLLYDETVRRGRSKKLESKWIGPYLIIEKHNDVNYTIKMGRKVLRVHANRIKPFIEH